MAQRSRRRKRRVYKKYKKYSRITRWMQGKMQLIVLLSLLVVVAVLVNCFRLVFENGKDYEKIVLDQQQSTSSVLPYKRGNITDCNGNILATSIKVYTVVLDPKTILDDKYFEATMKALTDTFNEFTYEELVEELNARSNTRYYVRSDLKKLSFDEISDLKALLESGDNTRVKGISFEESYQRRYPYQTLACHVLGFSTGSSTPTYGIEGSYNDYLIGTDGRKFTYVSSDSDDTVENVEKAAVDGSNVVSTIDMKIQQIVEEKIAEYQAEINSAEISVLVMDPNSGEILAMASDKEYDLSNPSDYVTYYGEERAEKYEKREKKLEEYQEELSRLEALRGEAETTSGEESTEETEYYDDVLSQEEISETTEDSQEEEDSLDTQIEKLQKKIDKLNTALSTARGNMWKNKIISNTFEPGSTAKPFTIAAALEEGVVTTEDTFYCDGGEQVADFYIKCSENSGHGVLTLSGALAKSCNDALMSIGFKLGADKYREYQSRFGFGNYTGIDLPGEANGILLAEGTTYGDTSLATNSFGQNFTVTMPQIASGFCSLINGGYYYTPHVVKSIEAVDGTVIKNYDTTPVKQTVTAETSKYLREALREVVTDGTGFRADIDGYEVGGKTGTAEKLPRGNNQYVLSFIGGVPISNPEVVCYVVIDTPQEDSDNSAYATRFFNMIMSEVLPYMNIYPTLEVEESDSDASLTDESLGVTDSYGASTGDTTTYDSDSSDTYSYDTGAENTDIWDSSGDGSDTGY